MLRIRCQETFAPQTSCVWYAPRDPGDIRKEWVARENDRVLNVNDGESLKTKRGRGRTHVSDGDSEEDGKDPEVKVKPLARRSTFVRNPEREEPEQPDRIESVREYFEHFQSTKSTDK